MDVREILTAKIKELGAEGLCDDDPYEPCGCTLDDFAPCGCTSLRCVPAKNNVEKAKEHDVEMWMEPLDDDAGEEGDEGGGR